MSTDKPEIGRIAFREEGEWWVAYYALPNTMKDAIELGRIQIAFVANGSKVKYCFMDVIHLGVSMIVPEFRIAHERVAPEHERGGHG